MNRNLAGRLKALESRKKRWFEDEEYLRKLYAARIEISWQMGRGDLNLEEFEKIYVLENETFEEHCAAAKARMTQDLDEQARIEKAVAERRLANQVYLDRYQEKLEALSKRKP